MSHQKIEYVMDCNVSAERLDQISRLSRKVFKIAEFDPEGTYILAMSGKDILGMCQVTEEDSGVYIWNFCVKPEERRNGVGTGILSHTKLCFGEFFAEVYADNPHLDFYLNRGAEIVSYNENEKFYTVRFQEQNELTCKKVKRSD